MKKLISLCFSAFITFAGCGGSDPEPTPPVETPLEANAGEDKTAEALSKVTLKGDASKGPTGFTYSWTYTSTEVAVGDISFENTGAANASFIPPKNGVYKFQLTVTSGTKSSSDDVMVTVSGGVVIVATLPAGFIFKDIESDPTKPDYRASSTVTIADQNTTFPAGLVIEFAEGAGLVIKHNVTIKDVTLTSPTSWKGIFIDPSYSLTIDGCKIQNAGAALFEGETENAAIISAGTVALTNTTFSGSTGFDVLVHRGVSNDKVEGNTFTSQTPIKVPAGFVRYINDNTFPNDYDYIAVSTSGSDGTSGMDNLIFSDKKYFIEDDLLVGIGLTFEAGAHILMAEDKGIYSSGNFTISGTEQNPVVMEGVDDAGWTGISLEGQVSISYLNIDGAGSNAPNYVTWQFNPGFAAAINLSTMGTIENCRITNAHSYGLSLSSHTKFGDARTITGNTFEWDSEMPAIRVDYTRATFLDPANNNIFNGPNNAAYVELVSYGEGDTDRSGNPEIKTFHPLSNGGYYLISEDIVLYKMGVTIKPGTIMKFKEGVSIRTAALEETKNFPGMQLLASGTEEAPIIFEGVTDTPGAWGGISLDRYFELEHCVIKNGGGVLMPGATEKANLVVKPFSYGQNIYYFNHCEVSGSAGYGAILEDGAPDQGLNAPERFNTFSNNASGDALKK